MSQMFAMGLLAAALWGFAYNESHIIMVILLDLLSSQLFIIKLYI